MPIRFAKPVLEQASMSFQAPRARARANMFWLRRVLGASTISSKAWPRTGSGLCSCQYVLPSKPRLGQVSMSLREPGWASVRAGSITFFAHLDMQLSKPWKASLQVHRLKLGIYSIESNAELTWRCGGQHPSFFFHRYI